MRQLRKSGLVVLLLVVVLSMVALATVSGQQKSVAADYPKFAIKIIVPTSAGGGYDLGARLIARYLPKYLPKKVDVVVDNQNGAAQMIGVHATYAAAPDGYTIGAFNAVGALMAQFVRPEDVKFDMNKFVFLGMWQQDIRAIGLSNDLSVKTWDELIASSIMKPILCGTGGAGTSQHIDAMMLEAISALDLKYVHYDGSAQVEPAMGRKEIKMEVAQVSTIVTLEEQKIGKAFCVIAEKRSPGAPNVPTALEVGMPREMFDKLMAIPFFGVDRAVAAPPGTDPAIVEILRTAVWKVFQDPDYQADVKKMKGENNPMEGKDYQLVVAKKIKAAQENKELINKLKF